MSTETPITSTQTIVPESILSTESQFIDRRQNSGNAPGVERRQFANTYGDLSDESRELALAIDQYKLVHRRRFITYDEMLAVIKTLGYHK